MEQKNKENQICRAFISSVDGGEWDFEAVAVPFENKQLRYSFENNEYYYEVLRTNPENIKAGRLESGLPLFDNHPYEKSTKNTLGITVGYEFSDEGILIRGKWGARADQELKDDVKNKIVKTVSIEGTILKYSIERKEGELPTYYVELWEPDSLSFAPIPNDIGAQIEVKRALKEQIQRSKKPESDSFLNTLTKKFK